MILFSLNFVSKGPIGYNPSQVQAIISRPAGKEPLWLPEPMMPQFNDVYIGPPASKG